MLIADAHLDLGYNVFRGRDVTRPAAEQPVVQDEIATVGLPDLKAGGVGLICATLFAVPGHYNPRGYHDAEGARAGALSQLDWYRAQEAAGRLRIVRRRDQVPLEFDAGGPLPAILLMEGADPLRTPDDVAEWFAAGLRIVGLAWERTRFAGGTGHPGPLTPAGVEMAKALDCHKIIHDTSHLSDESFWQLLDLVSGPVMASHSNCRAIVPGDRHLTDDMIRALVARGAVIGLNFYDQFLLPPEIQRGRRVTLADLVAHVKHVCDLAGSAQHVALGTDMDGGLGRDQIPVEVKTIADLRRVADALSNANFGDTAIRQIMGENWSRFFRANLGEARTA
jgi:membrane dipeptidase